jgi:hypothetical protein
MQKANRRRCTILFIWGGGREENKEVHILRKFPGSEYESEIVKQVKMSGLRQGTRRYFVFFH